LALVVINPADYRRRFRAVALANDLDETLAAVDLGAEDLAEVARLGAEDFLNKGL
jgi:hypothetical protein